MTFTCPNSLDFRYRFVSYLYSSFLKSLMSLITSSIQGVYLSALQYYFTYRTLIYIKLIDQFDEFFLLFESSETSSLMIRNAHKVFFVRIISSYFVIMVLTTSNFSTYQLSRLILVSILSLLIEVQICCCSISSLLILDFLSVIRTSFNYKQKITTIPQSKTS